VRDPRPLRQAAVALAGALCAAAAAARPPVTFHVTLVDPPGEVQPLLGGVNAQGHVAGAAILPGESAEHALLLSTGRFVDLGTLGGRASYATDVNDADVAVGTSETANGADHAFRWRRGKMTDLGTLPGGTLSQAQAINRSGQVVGFATVASAVNHAFLVDGGPMTDLGTLPGAGASAARGINTQGHVVGDSGSALQTHAFLYVDGAMAALDTPGGAGASSVATAINDADQVAGAAWDPADGLPTTAVRWDAGVPSLLGLPDAAGATSSYARAINARGIVVGTFARPQAPLAQGAFISDGTRIANLEDLLDTASAAWQVYAAMGIADDDTVSALVWDGSAFRFALLQPD